MLTLTGCLMFILIVPGPVTNLKPRNTLPYEVSLLWDAPTVNAQEVIGYTIAYSGRKQND